MAKAHGAFWDRCEQSLRHCRGPEGLLEALRGLSKISRCQKTVSYGHKALLGLIEGFKVPKSSFGGSYKKVREALRDQKHLKVPNVSFGGS